MLGFKEILIMVLLLSWPTLMLGYQIIRFEMKNSTEKYKIQDKIFVIVIGLCLATMFIAGKMFQSPLLYLIAFGGMMSQMFSAKVDRVF